MNKIANYDTQNYDYSTYWKEREYEHKSEELVLNRFFQNIKGNYFLDVGGSFGRLLPTYYRKFNNCIVLDYSLKTLQRNSDSLTKQFPNLTLIAGNAYNLPFKENIFDCALMVRVLHHLAKPQEYFAEISKVLIPSGIYIQEYANKYHLKAVIRALINMDSTFFNGKPYQQPDRENNEGARKNASVPFYNYPNSWILRKTKDVNFHLLEKSGCSFFRVRVLKKIFNTDLLLFFEKIFQYLLSWSNLSPSIFLKFKRNGKQLKQKIYSLEEILACPKCKNDIVIQGSKATCKKCSEIYHKKENIWDFRI